MARQTRYRRPHRNVASCVVAVSGTNAEPLLQYGRRRSGRSPS